MEQHTIRLFPCTSCGACCRQINKLVEALQLSLSEDHVKELFPYSYDETGKCEKLNDDNTCSIYHDRPSVCNVEELSHAVDMPTDEFYQLAIKSCNALMDEKNIDKKFRIPLQDETKEET